MQPFLSLWRCSSMFFATRGRARGICSSESEILLGKSKLGQHRVQQPGTNFLLAVFDGHEPASIIKSAMAPLSRPRLEPKRNASNVRLPLDPPHEFRRLHDGPLLIGHFCPSIKNLSETIVRFTAPARCGPRAMAAFAVQPKRRESGPIPVIA